MANIPLNKRIFMLFSLDHIGDLGDVVPIGTGFGIDKPGIVLTAHHVIKKITNIRVVSTFYSPPLNIEVDDIVAHPHADIAALLIKEQKLLEYFKIGKPPDGYNDFPLGEDVISYGFPMMGTERPIPPRMMKGHIQRIGPYKDDEYYYSAYELGFPSFHGQSGSPILRDFARNEAIGIVTKSVSFTSENEGNLAGATCASWSSLTAYFRLDKGIVSYFFYL